MSVSVTSRALTDLEKIASHLRFSEILREKVAENSHLLNQMEVARCVFDSKDLSTFDNSFSKRMEHSLVYAAAYAVYENYVGARMESVLRLYERSISYDQLSVRSQKAFRNGTLKILSRMNWRRYSHLDDQILMKNYLDAIVGKALKFTDEAILSADANLRINELKEVLLNCGLENSWALIIKDDRLKDFLIDTILEDNSLESVMNFIVQRRNDCAHSVPSEIDSQEILLDVINFVVILVNVIHDATSSSIIEFMVANGNLVQIGTVFERYRKVIGVSKIYDCHSVELRQDVVIESHNELVHSKVISLRIDENSVAYCRGSNFLQVGIEFDRPISKTSKIYGFVTSLDVDLIQPVLS